MFKKKQEKQCIKLLKDKEKLQLEELKELQEKQEELYLNL